MAPEETVERLKAYSRRLRASVVRAISLLEVWASLNEAGPTREAISLSPTSAAAQVIWEATLRELVLILVRVFDPPGDPRRGTDRVSFPVINEQLKKPEVAALLIGAARGWQNGWEPPENAATAERAIRLLGEVLARLQNEEPNRARRLRHFRDEFLAHELDLKEQRDRPTYDNLSEMVEEVVQLSNHAGLAVEGATTHWPHGTVRRSADALWDCVARAHPI